MTQSERSYVAPPEAVTSRNLEKAIKNLSGIKQSMTAIVEASVFEENEGFAGQLLEQALLLFEIGETMSASIPV